MRAGKIFDSVSGWGFASVSIAEKGCWDEEPADPELLGPDDDDDEEEAAVPSPRSSAAEGGPAWIVMGRMRCKRRGGKDPRNMRVGRVWAVRRALISPVATLRMVRIVSPVTGDANFLESHDLD